MKIFQKYAAEFLGTFMLVGIGTGAMITLRVAQVEEQDSGAFVLAVSLAFGIALIVALYALGGISGGHFNPAVSLAAFLDRRISIIDMVGYWAAQVAGALSASALLAWVYNRVILQVTYPQLANGRQLDSLFQVKELSGFFVEAVLALVFVFAVLVLAKSESHTKYIGMGLAFTGVHLVGLQLTGAAVNPARALAPAVLGGNYTGIWVYLAGPALGAIVAWALYKIVVEGDIKLGDDFVAVKDAVVEDTTEAIEGVKEVF